MLGIILQTLNLATAGIDEESYREQDLGARSMKLLYIEPES
jgi:hypothetical protein